MFALKQSPSPKALLSGQLYIGTAQHHLRNDCVVLALGYELGDMRERRRDFLHDFRGWLPSAPHV